MKKEPIKMAVVGAGYFGNFHCAKISSLPGVKLEAVVDIDSRRARQTAQRFDAVPLASHNDIKGGVDAAVVAVPTSSHYQVALDLLGAGLDLLVEKPLATSPDEADHLCRLAADRALRLQVGHLERYNPVFLEAIRRIKVPKYVRMERLGPFPGRGGDVDVVLEIMTHDLDILLQLSQAPVGQVSASGWSVLNHHLDVVTARIKLEDGLVADILASRVSSRTVRKFTVLDQDGLLSVDLAGHRILRVSKNSGRKPSSNLRLEPGDPLLDQDRAFVEVLRNGQQPRVDGDVGKAAVALASRIRGCALAGSAW